MLRPGDTGQLGPGICIQSERPRGANGIARIVLPIGLPFYNPELQRKTDAIQAAEKIMYYQ